MLRLSSTFAGEPILTVRLGVCNLEGNELESWESSSSSSILIPFFFNNCSYLRSFVARSSSLTLRLRRRVGALAIHSTRAFVQFEQGFCLSHLTFRCWHNTQECPRVSFVTFGDVITPGVVLENPACMFIFVPKARSLLYD